MDLLQNLDPSLLPYIAVGCALLCVAAVIIGFVLQAVSGFFDVLVGLIEIVVEVLQGGTSRLVRLRTSCARMCWLCRPRLSAVECSGDLRGISHEFLPLVWFHPLMARKLVSQFREFTLRP